MRSSCALWGAIFFSVDAALDQRADRTNQLWSALPGRHAIASVRALRAAGDADRWIRRLSGTGGVDLGAYGPYPRARRLGFAAVRGSCGEPDPRGALSTPRCGDDR